MINLNTKPNWRSVLLLILLASGMYFTWLGVAELRLSDEALNAAFAQELVAEGNFMESHLYGKTVSGFPLYSWCVALCSLGRMPNSFTLRLPAVLALFVLALASGLFARKIQSPFAGIIAAFVVLTSFLSLRIGCRAQNDILVSALLASSWFLIYYFGWINRKWTLAWGIALALLFVASMGAGAKAILIFYLPFLFMGRRLRSMEILQAPVHLAFALIFVIALCVLHVYAPSQPFMPWNALIFVTPPETFGSYCSHIVTMLPKLMYYLFPWTLLAWAPFCVAMRPFEANEYACRFLRAIVTTNAVMFWLIPGGAPLSLIPVFGPMAVLIAVYAEIVLRRYRDFWQNIINFFSRLAMWCGLLCSVYWLLVLYGIIALHGFSPVSIWGCLVASVVVMLAMAVSVYGVRLDLNFRSRMLLLFFACITIYKSTYDVQRSWLGQRRHVNGLRLAGFSNEKETNEAASSVFSFAQTSPLSTIMAKHSLKRVYLVLPKERNCADILVESFYMQCSIKQINDVITDLPEDENEVLVLSPYLPADTTRRWRSVSQDVCISCKRECALKICSWDELKSWRRPFIELMVTHDNESESGVSARMMRLYLGVKNEIDEHL